MTTLRIYRLLVTQTQDEFQYLYLSSSEHFTTLREKFGEASKMHEVSANISYPNSIDYTSKGYVTKVGNIII